MNSFCISGWPLQDQGPPAHTVRVRLRDGSAVHDSGATLCLAFAALCVNCCHNNTNRAKTKRATNCQHDSNSSSSNRDNKQLAAIVVVAADVAAFAVYCLLGVIFIGAYYLHIPARSGVLVLAHCTLLSSPLSLLSLLLLLLLSTLLCHCIIGTDSSASLSPSVMHIV